MTTTELVLDAQQYPSAESLLTDTAGYHVRLATTEADVRAAQQLRHEVFSGDTGSISPGPVGIDREEFDDRCDHLILWQQGRNTPPQAVSTCRLFPPHSNDSVPRSAGLDIDREFGLMPLERLMDSTVEAGKACVRVDHRTGAAVSLLIGGVARYLHLTGYRYLLGIAPIDLRDGGHNLASIWDLALTRYLAPAERRCRPRDPVAIGALQRAVQPQVPALLAGYLRLGAKVCGPPGHNEMTGVADLLLLLDLQTTNPRYLHRFLVADG